MKPKLEAPGTKRLTLKCNGPLSSFAFKFILRRYTTVLYVRGYTLVLVGLRGWCLVPGVLCPRPPRHSPRVRPSCPE
jgi:hypothetical protein